MSEGNLSHFGAQFCISDALLQGSSLHIYCRRDVVDLRADPDMVAEGKSTPYKNQILINHNAASHLADQLTYGKLSSLPKYNGTVKKRNSES